MSDVIDLLAQIGNTLVEGFEFLINGFVSAIYSVNYLLQGTTSVSTLITEYFPMPDFVKFSVIGVITFGLLLFVIRLVTGGGSNG